MTPRFAIVAAACLLLGACASQDKHTFDSTAHLPTTVSLMDTTNDTVFWKLEVPVGCRLKLDFDRAPEIEYMSVNPLFPATKMRWTLHHKDQMAVIKRGEEKLCGTPYIIKVAYRNAPEVPECPPGSCLQVASNLQLSADRPGPGVQPAPVQVTVHEPTAPTASQQWQAQHDATTAPAPGMAPAMTAVQPMPAPAALNPAPQPVFMDSTTAAMPSQPQPYPTVQPMPVTTTAVQPMPAPAAVQPMPASMPEPQWTIGPASAAPAPAVAPRTAQAPAASLGQVRADDYYHPAPPPAPAPAASYAKPVAVTVAPVQTPAPQPMVTASLPALPAPQPVVVAEPPRPVAVAALPALPAPQPITAIKAAPVAEPPMLPVTVAPAPAPAPQPVAALPALPAIDAPKANFAAPSPAAVQPPVAKAVNGNRMVPLAIKTELLDKYEAKTVSILVEGVPLNASLTAGRNNGSGIWTLSGDQLVGLAMALPPTVTEDVQLMIIATAPKTDGDTDSTVSNLIVKVSPLASAGK